MADNYVMVEIGSRRRNQPAPPRVIFEALTQPDRDPARPWLILLPDEQRPRVVAARPPAELTWSSLWPSRPGITIHFELPPDAGSGTDLRWTLHTDGPPPDPSALGHLRKRLNQLIKSRVPFVKIGI